MESTSGPTDNESGDFDSATIKAALEGTWRFPCKMEKSGVSYIHFTIDGRCFELISLGPESKHRINGLIQYYLESPAILRFRNQRGRVSYPIPLQFEDDTLTLIHPGRRVFCTRVHDEQIPDWYRNALNAALSRNE